MLVKQVDGHWTHKRFLRNYKTLLNDTFTVSEPDRTENDFGLINMDWSQFPSQQKHFNYSTIVGPQGFIWLCVFIFFLIEMHLQKPIKLNWTCLFEL